MILAHNYQVPWIQDVADYVGDFLALSQRRGRDRRRRRSCSAACTSWPRRRSCCRRRRRCCCPTSSAGCSLAASIDGDQLRAWKAEHPGAVVVAYVNTTAEVKAESDICCTSSNAVEVVALDPGGPGDPVPAGPVPGRARRAADRPEDARLDGGVPRARGDRAAATCGRRWRPSPTPS